MIGPMEAIDTPTPRWTAEELVRGTDQLVRDAYRIAARANIEQPSLVPSTWLWRHDIFAMHLGRVVNRLAEMVFKPSREPKAIPPLPMHPDVRLLHSDLRAVGHDTRRAFKRCEATRKR